MAPDAKQGAAIMTARLASSATAMATTMPVGPRGSAFGVMTTTRSATRTTRGIDRVNTTRTLMTAD